MPTFDTADSSATYDPPDALDEFKLVIVGGEGGDANPGKTGGAAGKVECVFAPASGETFTAYVGENGASTEDGSTVPGGNSPLADAGDGGYRMDGVYGGGGGAASALERDSDTTIIAVGEGGGGGGGGDFVNATAEYCGGGGGSRGGLGGSGTRPGGDAQGTGAGGDGGGGGIENDPNESDPQPGDPGGASAVATATNVSTTTVSGPTPRVEIVDQPRNVTLSVTGHTDTSVDLSLDGVNYESVTLHRSTSSGFTPDSGNQVASFSTSGAQTYSDTGLTQGTTYHYKAVFTNPAGDTASPERTQQTDAPAPTFDALAAVDDNGDGNADELQCEWTENGTDETAYRVLLSTDGGSSFTNDSGDLAADTTTYTTAEKPDGEQYTVTIRAVYPDTTADSATKQATTELPDVTVASITPIDASVEDELTPRNATVADNGDVRYQARIAGSGNAYGSAGEVVVAQGGAAPTFTNLLDGEEYDIRARSETAHVTGSYVTVEKITLLPAPNIGTPTVGATSVTVPWTDTADNEDQITVDRRREYSDGFGPYEDLATLAANTTSYTDDTSLPGSTYDYRVVNETEHVRSASTVRVTTDSLRPADDAPTSGWYVEVDTANGTRTPSIVGTPQRNPSINDLERVTIPVPKDDAWDVAAFEDATARVYHDGERLPVDTLIERRQTAGRTDLVCEGPTDLYTPDTYEFSNTDVHAAFQTVASDAGLAVDVEPPESDNRLFATIDTENDFRDVFQDPGDATPVAIRSDGTLEPQQTCWVYEGENHGNASTQSFGTGDFPEFDDFSITLAEDVVPDLAEISQTFTTERELPSSEVGVKLRRATKDLGGEFQVELDGQLVYAELNTGNTDIATTWFEAVGGTSYESDQTGQAVDPPPTLSPGEHTITIRNIDVSPGGQSEPSTGIAAVDLFAVYDKRYAPSFPTTTNSNDALPGPSRYPTVQPILLHEGFLSATGGRFEGTFTDLSGPQEVAISNDYGGNYTTASNTDTVETDFASPGADIQLRVTLGSYGNDSSTPAGGQQPQALKSYDLFEDTRNSPPLTNDQFEGDRKDILTALVERGDALWAAEWDRDAGAPVIRMANVGDLTADRELDLVDYEWSTQTLGRQVERATIKGGAESVAGETVTADVLNGNPLDRSNLVVGRERVRSVSTGERYRRGTDYEMNYAIGQLNPRQFEGNISDGEDLAVDYEYKPEGDYAQPGFDDRNRLIETFVDASTDTICQSIAFYLVERLGSPVESGTLTISELPAGYSVLEAIAADPLPNRERWTPRPRPTVQQGRVELEVASRRRVQDVVSDLQTRLQSHSDRI